MWNTILHTTMYIWEVLSDNNIMQWLDSSSIRLCDVITVSKSFVLPTTIRWPNESYLRQKCSIHGISIAALILAILLSQKKKGSLLMLVNKRRILERGQNWHDGTLWTQCCCWKFFCSGIACVMPLQATISTIPPPWKLMAKASAILVLPFTSLPWIHDSNTPRWL